MVFCLTCDHHCDRVHGFQARYYDVCLFHEVELNLCGPGIHVWTDGRERCDCGARPEW